MLFHYQRVKIFTLNKNKFEELIFLYAIYLLGEYLIIKKRHYICGISFNIYEFLLITRTVLSSHSGIEFCMFKYRFHPTCYHDLNVGDEGDNA